MKVDARLVPVVLALALVASVAWWLGSSVRRAGAPAAAPVAEEAAGGDRPLEQLADPAPESASTDRREAGAAPSPAAPEPGPGAAEGPIHAGHAGRVRDLRGDPVGGIAVYQAAPGADLARGEPFAVADAAGVFTWTRLAWAVLLAESEELTTVLPAFAGSGACVIVVGPRRDYAGMVVDERGAGLGGARLRVQMEAGAARRLLPGEERGQARAWRTTSAADGSFRLNGVGWTEELALVGELEGFEEGRALLPPQSTLALELVLRRPAPGPRTVEGTVVDTAGQPVEGALVAFEQGESVQSDREGSFAVPAPPGLRGATLWAVKAGHAPARRDLDDIEAYLAASTRAPLVLTLGERPESIAGRVLASDGSPVAGAWVFTRDLTPWMGRTSVETPLATGDFPGVTGTSADGHFLLEGLLPRPYTLHALDPRTLEVVTREAVPAGARDVLLVLSGAEALRRVAGRVLDPRGEPVAGVWLFYGRLSTPRVERLRSPLVTSGAPQTDADGAFEFPGLCVEGAYLLPAGAGIAQQQRFELAPALDLEQLVLTVSRTCRFQVVLSDPAEADRFTLLDDADQPMWLGYTLGNTALSTNGGLDLAGGRSEVVECDERARTIVLLKEGREVRRVPFLPAAEGVQIVQP